jgi:DNA-binding LacI/PurR family transcriptional regulator
MTVMNPSAGRRLWTIALVVAEEDPFLSRAVGGVRSVLGPLDVPVSVRPAPSLAEFDGVLVVSQPPADGLPRRLVEAGVPAVLFGRPAEPLPISFVDIDHPAAAKLAADRLVDHGCRCIATITGPLDTPAGQDRLGAFRAAMAHRGVAYVPCVEGGSTRVEGERAMERLLLEVPAVDGIYAANEDMAQGALLVLRARGRRVPADVIMVGFGDSRPALASRPPLTTIHQPVEEMGAEMARLLLAQLDGLDARTRSVIFAPTLVQRLSA